MIEVEAKIKVSDSKFFIEKSKKIGKYIGKQTKVDDYYTLEGKGKYPQKSLRIRKLNGIYQVNFKHRLSFKEGIHAKKEVEFKAKNIKEILSLISEFGFRKWLTKKKVTFLYEIEKHLHIEINNVQGLGSFIEIECLVEKNNEVNKARIKIMKTLTSLGISNKNLIKEGYTKMLWDKTHS